MEFTWAASVDKSHVKHLASLRLQPEIEAGSADDAWWLRGPSSAEVLRRVRMIPHVQLFHLDTANTLRPWDRLLAVGELPDIEFAPISKLVKPVLPSAGWPAARIERVPLSLTRSSRMLPASVLITSLQTWKRYAISAPVIRLRRWKFAASTDQRVIIRGEPLPPLTGQQFGETHGVAIPVGWECSPALEGAVLSAVLDADSNGLVLLLDDGMMEIMPAAAFVAATRSAARRS